MRIPHPDSLIESIGNQMAAQGSATWVELPTKWTYTTIDTDVSDAVDRDEDAGHAPLKVARLVRGILCGCFTVAIVVLLLQQLGEDAAQWQADGLNRTHVR